MYLVQWRNHHTNQICREFYETIEEAHNDFRALKLVGYPEIRVYRLIQELTFTAN